MSEIYTSMASAVYPNIGTSTILTFYGCSLCNQNDDCSIRKVITARCELVGGVKAKITECRKYEPIKIKLDLPNYIPSSIPHVNDELRKLMNIPSNRILQELNAAQQRLAEQLESERK